MSVPAPALGCHPRSGSERCTMARSRRSRLRWRLVPRARRRRRPTHPALRTLLRPSNNNLRRLCDRLYRRTRRSLRQCRRRRTTKSPGCRLRLRACRSATTRTSRRSRRRSVPVLGVTSLVWVRVRTRTRTRTLVGGHICRRNRLRGRTGGVEPERGQRPCDVDSVASSLVPAPT
mgnify:CR=1 FL=1